MDKSAFGQIVAHPAGIAPECWEELRRVREAYPYCAPVQVLSLMADKMGGTPLWEVQSLPRVLLYLMDGEDLGRRLEGLDGRGQTPSAATTENPTAKVLPQPEEDYDILKEINAYQEISFKTAPKSVILSNFLEKDGGIALDAAGFEEVPVQELAKKSIQPVEALETETMAVMLMRQGKVEKAIAIYEKLISKNPEKSSIFAARIAEARQQLTK